jgi:hypothetical protein
MALGLVLSWQGFCVLVVFRGLSSCPSSGLKTWQRPTLPRLETEYHWRGGFSRPSSGWDRVRTPRYGHQVVGTDDMDGARLDAEDGWFCVRASEEAEYLLGGVAPGFVPMREIWIKPIERLVPVGYACCHACTPGLST